MNHSDVRNHLADYLEGDLELGKRALIDAHLDECEDCSGDLGEMQSTIALLRSMPEPEVPQGLVPNVMRRVRNGEGRRGWLDGAHSALSWLMSPAVLYPASVSLILAGVLMATGQIQVTLPLQPISLPNGQVVRVVPTPPGAAISQLAREQHGEQRRLAAAPSAASSTAPSAALRAQTGLSHASPLRAGQRDVVAPRHSVPLQLSARSSGGQYLLSSRLHVNVLAPG